MRKATTDDIARIARAAGEAGDAGIASYRADKGEMFNLNETGYCTRFVRQVHEAALDLPAFGWPYSGPNAIALEAKLKGNGKQIDDPVPGDIVCINRNSGQYGHVGIFLGNGKFAENTSSTVRGPGTTISNISAVAARISGYYRVLPLPDSGDVSSWAEDAVAWVRAEGLMTNDIMDNQFHGQDAVTREQLAVVLKRLHDYFYR